MTIKIEYLDGPRLYNAISDGVKNLASHQQTLDEINVFPVPGVSAATTAMSISGFDDQYFFYGFLPKKNKAAEKEINFLKDFDFNIVFFVPAIKINFYINLFKKKGSY